MNDRIAQMAREVGFDEYEAAALYRHLYRFARLVAEDCAKLVDGNAAQCSGMTAELMHSNADAIRARYK